jgi:hypothetical protein
MKVTSFIHENNCSRSKRILESFKSYGWYIFIPIIAMVITFVVIVYIIRLGAADASTVIVTVLAGIIPTIASLYVRK